MAIYEIGGFKRHMKVVIAELGDSKRDARATIATWNSWLQWINGDDARVTGAGRAGRASLLRLWGRPPVCAPTRALLLLGAGCF